ncbi:MAG: hypothetical protein Q7U99_19505 [Rubrivivax sp.]|nr:hypothetical protein [Rubrivivax sp.]
MSAESGINTFRDALGGHWARFDPMELASPEGFRGNTDSIQLHGDILEDRWLNPCPRHTRGGHVCAPGWATAGSPPSCDECGNTVRPGVV